MQIKIFISNIQRKVWLSYGLIPLKQAGKHFSKSTNPILIHSICFVDCSIISCVV